MGTEFFEKVSTREMSNRMEIISHNKFLSNFVAKTISSFITVIEQKDIITREERAVLVGLVYKDQNEEKLEE